jgi:hypothetical protein
MVVGLLLIAMISGATVSVALLFMSSPLWVALIAYPAAGTLVMLVGAAAIFLLGRLRSTGVIAQCPVQRSTTPKVATSTLTSVASDTVRS